MELGKGEAFDTFPNMFPNEQFLKAAEIKHGRQAMLAWTGVWATSTVRTTVGSPCSLFEFFLTVVLNTPPTHEMYYPNLS